MSTRRSRSRVAPFIARYGVDEGEFAQPSNTYQSFNDFFSRQLKPSARPISELPGSVVFPADGRHLGFPDVGATNQFYAKGQLLNLAELLGDEELGRKYEHGSLVISRLCPVDYHRFHFPCAGVSGDPELVNGMLYSVSPIALRRNLGYLTQNKRVITHISGSECGRAIMIEIGATCVGTIVQTSRAGPVLKGQEKGYFRFGGSCVISLFEPRTVSLAEDLINHSHEGREIYARMGDHLGTVVPR
jgi:phosphatidylserine decarboxylase